MSSFCKTRFSHAAVVVAQNSPERSEGSFVQIHDFLRTQIWTLRCALRLREKSALPCLSPDRACAAPCERDIRLTRCATRGADTLLQWASRQARLTLGGQGQGVTRPV